MKTLYISDLDGTLLNKNAALSPDSIQMLNELIDQGMDFSIATARTAATVCHILKDVHIHMPVVLMNGVAVYDMAAGKYINAHIMDPSSVDDMLKVLNKYKITVFLYTLENERLNTYYEKIYADHARRFMDERIQRYRKKFTGTDSLARAAAAGAVYISVFDRKEILSPVYQELSADRNLHLEFYRDIYEEDLWYLEVCSSLASKYSAVKFLRTRYGFDRVISFGDNLNDLPMFRASDECYAVENARREVKEQATAVIESNRKDGVANWLNLKIRKQK